MKQLQLLPPPFLHDRHKQLRLATLFKVVEELVPALPPEQFLTSVCKDRRTLKAATYDNLGFDNPVIRRSRQQQQQQQQSLCLQARPNSSGTVFVRTACDCNQLSQETVSASCSDTSTYAVGRTRRDDKQ